MMATLAEQLARRVRVAAGPHDNPDMSVQQIVYAMAARIAELEDKTEELDRLLKEALMAFDIICPECRNQWLHRHCRELPATAKDERIAELEVALRAFTGAAYPVSTQLDGKGYRWSTAYLDEALAIAKPLLAQQGKEGET